MSERGSKAAAIREYIEQNPTAKASEIVEALGKKRIKVSSSQVYGAITKLKAAKPGSAVHEEASLYSPALAPVASNGHEDIANQPLLHAKQFAKACGGISEARKVLDTLNSLQV